jgi:membrane associated rhomboid family serine protease
MKGDPSIALGLPRPGRGLKAVLIAVAAFGLLNGFLAAWVPSVGAGLFDALVCDFEKVLHGQLWRLVSSGLLTDPGHLGDLIWTLAGLYFLAPDLERRWGDKRLILFLLGSIVAGNLLVLGVDLLTPDTHLWARFHQPVVYGSWAAVAAISVAWARDNANLVVRLFFVLPVRGQWLLWITVGFAVLQLVFPSVLPEGVVAPFGGIAVGLLFGGTPSLARSLYLRLKLVLLRRRANTLRVADVLGPRPPRRPRPGAPPLRVVPGGIDDALKKHEPPKDKRYLN